MNVLIDVDNLLTIRDTGKSLNPHFTFNYAEHVMCLSCGLPILYGCL